MHEIVKRSSIVDPKVCCVAADKFKYDQEAALLLNNLYLIEINSSAFSKETGGSTNSVLQNY